MEKSNDLESFSAKLSAYIKAREPEKGEVQIEGLERLGGGSSREMYRFRLIRHLPNGVESEPHAIILRKDPPGQGLVANSERKMEFGVIKALKDTDVPVPEVFWLEEDPSQLGTPFFAMTEITGGETDGMLFSSPPFESLRASVAKDKWTIMGNLARLDPEKLGLIGLLPEVSPKDCWKRELDFWEAMVEDNRTGPQPTTAATIRHLRRNPPNPPKNLAIVHGDYRTGNFLFGTNGHVLGILDWEMAHLGDPLEDLAYSLTVQYASLDGELSGNLVAMQKAIAYWEQASGLTADPQDLLWWRLLTTVKFQGLWASGAAGWQSGDNPDVVMVAASWSCGSTHEREALQLMDRL